MRRANSNDGDFASGFVDCIIQHPAERIDRVRSIATWALGGSGRRRRSSSRGARQISRAARNAGASSPGRGPIDRTTLSRQLRFQSGELLGHFRVVLDIRGDGADGVEDGGVIAAAEVAADFLEAVAGVTAGQKHADLRGKAILL